jgi:hypothetical protein
MPVRIFSGVATEAAALEAQINDWMAKLEPGAVRQVSAASSQEGRQIVVTIWYTESKDHN